MRIAVTADLHLGNRSGEAATRDLAASLHQQPPDLLLLAGDLGPRFDDALALFEALPCPKALVPGNHDLWVLPDAPHDSLDAYERLLPEAAARHGFHYLDAGPLLMPEFAVVGSVNWYDYSWSLDELRRRFPDEEHRLASKRFPRGRHNDAVYVRLPMGDVGFTDLVRSRLERHLDDALSRREKAIVVTHHPPFQGLCFPPPEGEMSLTSLLWAAFSGNAGVEQLLARYADRVPLAFCGHTHWARENNLGAIRGYNVGGDYPEKRLLLVDWPSGAVEAREFGGAAGEDSGVS
jgi:predicted phosphohydrolase